MINIFPESVYHNKELIGGMQDLLGKNKPSTPWLSEELLIVTLG